MPAPVIAAAAVGIIRVLGVWFIRMIVTRFLAQLIWKCIKLAAFAALAYWGATMIMKVVDPIFAQIESHLPSPEDPVFARGLQIANWLSVLIPWAAIFTVAKLIFGVEATLITIHLGVAGCRFVYRLVHD